MHMERLFKVIFDNQGQMYSGTRMWFPKCGHINVLIQFSTESIRVEVLTTEFKCRQQCTWIPQYTFA